MQTMLTARAGQRVGFSVDDLRANQQGELTEGQRQIAYHNYRAYVRNGLIGLVVMWLILTALIVGSLIAQGSQPDDMKVLPYVMVGMAAIFLVIALGSLWHGRDLREGRVRSVEGQAKTKIVTYRGRSSHSTGYELIIGRQKFRLTSEAQLVGFEDGLRYRVYYIPYAPLHVLLSAESLDAPT